MAPIKTQTSSGLPLLIVDAKEMGLLQANSSVRNYIAETWRKTMRRDPLYRKLVTLRNDAVWHRIERILDSPLTTVTVAMWPEAADELFIVGYLVSGLGVVHFAYVRERYRLAGVAGTLLLNSPLRGMALPVPCTHWSSNLPSAGVFFMKQGMKFSYAGMDFVPGPEKKAELVSNEAHS